MVSKDPICTMSCTHNAHLLSAIFDVKQAQKDGTRVYAPTNNACLPFLPLWGSPFSFVHVLTPKMGDRIHMYMRAVGFA